MTKFEEIKAASLRNLDMQIRRAERAKAAVEAATTTRELWYATPCFQYPSLDDRERTIHFEAMNLHLSEV